MTHSPARRPRFERAKVAGIKLTPRDLLILRAVSATGCCVPRIS
jgi:hypothetical protein